MTTTLGNVPVATPADHLPEQGQWTYERYAALPDDGQRYEILDGVLFMTPSPNEWHQTTAVQLTYHLVTHIERTGLGRVYIAPFDVELAPRTIVQPDVFVILNKNRDKITFSHVVGAPDLVIEISSPSTVDIDRREKRDLYAQAGVPEYWLVDPATQTAEVLVLEDTRTYKVLGVFAGEATIPSTVVPEIAAVQVKQFFG